MIIKTSIFVALQLLMTSCAVAPNASLKTDPLIGLIDLKSVKEAPSKKIVNPNKFELCMVISPNAERTLKYNEEHTKAKKNWNPVLREDLKEKISAVGDPKFIADSIVATLKKYFNKVVLLNDFNEVKSNSCQYSTVIDINLVNTDWTVSKSFSEIQAIFFDANIRLVSSVTGRGEHINPRDGSNEAYGSDFIAQKASIVDFDKALEIYLYH